MDRIAFIDQLRQSRLLPEEMTVQCMRRFEDAPAHVFAAALIDEGLLTPFQAKLLSAGRARELVLGQYRLLDELGQGGMGRVYKALHTVMDRLVAIKVVSPEFAADGRARGWFRREVLASTRLYHPNIVMAYDANEMDDVLFLVMEYVDGDDLDSLVRRQGPLPVSLACEMMRQAAQALQYAHEQGMVHRDVKPANLLVPRGVALADAAGGSPILVKVVDFGLASLRGPARAVSLLCDGEKGFLGSPDYVSPEQARDSHAADIRSDLYSLGCTFYFALTARKPFGGATVFETVVKHLETEAEPLELLRPETPAGVAAIVRRLMAKDPAKRFQTPAELLAEMSFLCGPDALRAGAAVPGVAFAAPPAPVGDTPEIPPVASPTNFLPELAFQSRAQAPRTSPEVAVEPPKETSPTHKSECVPSATNVMTSWPSAVLPEGPREEELPPAEPAAADEEPAACGDALRPAEVDPIFCKNWHTWTAVVASLARGCDHRRVDEAGYRALHGQLLAACRASAAADAPKRSLGTRLFFRRLETMIEPWLAPRAFEAADPATLLSLLESCRAVEQELDPHTNGWGVARWTAVLVSLLIAAVAGWHLQRVLNWAERGPFFSSVWRAIEVNPAVGLALVLPAVVLASLYLFSR